MTFSITPSMNPHKPLSGAVTTPASQETQEAPTETTKNCCHPQQQHNTEWGGHPMQDANLTHAIMMLMATIQMMTLSVLMGLTGQGGQRCSGNPCGPMSSLPLNGTHTLVPSTYGHPYGVHNGTPTHMGVVPSPQVASVLNWAAGEAGKGINENQHQTYIASNYSQGSNRKWCADFVSTAFERNGGSPWGHQASVAGIRQWGEQNGRWIPKEAGVPQAGDVMIMQNGVSHTGIVTHVENGRIYTVEGNADNGVRQRSYALNEARITGYVRPA